MEEIKAGDIMIGNIVTVDNLQFHPQLKDVPMVVKGISSNEKGYGVKLERVIPDDDIFADYSQLLKFIRPIPLTEDILLKAGGYKLPHMTVTDSVLFDIGRDRILSIGCIEDCNQMAWLQHIEGKKVTDLVCIHNYDYDGWLYLHTFQNLFKSLTGKELEVNL